MTRTRKIALSGERAKGLFAVVDESDYYKFSKYSWYLSAKGYACRRTEIGGVSKNHYIHRGVANTPDGKITDHIDGDKLNNCRNNLRVCNFSQNMQNRGPSKANKSGYRGVWWRKSRKRWTSNIRVNKKRIWVGAFKNKRDAAEAYNKAAKKYFGKFAFINPLPAPPTSTEVKP